MINFINNELHYAHKVYNERQDNNIIKTIEELESIKKDIFKYKDNSCESDLLRNLIDVKLSDSIYSFMLFMIEIYSKIPQLETETSIKYPIIRKQYISDKYIYDFSNRLLKNEKISIHFTFNNNNLIIFDNKNFKFKKPDSRCIVYKRYYTNNSMILLNKYNSIRDLVLPIKKFIEIIEYNNNIPFSNNTEIMEYYLQHKAIKKLIDAGNKDAYKLYISLVDNMVYNARLLKKQINNKDWKHLQPTIIFKLLDFTNQALAIELVNSNISFNDLYNILNSNNLNEYIDINNMPINKESVKANNKIYRNTLEKKQYY